MNNGLMCFDGEIEIKIIDRVDQDCIIDCVFYNSVVEAEEYVDSRINNVVSGDFDLRNFSLKRKLWILADRDYRNYSGNIIVRLLRCTKFFSTVALENLTSFDNYVLGNRVCIVVREESGGEFCEFLGESLDFLENRVIHLLSSMGKYDYFENTNVDKRDYIKLAERYCLYVKESGYISPASVEMFQWVEFASHDSAKQ